MITVKRYLHEHNIYRRATTSKQLVTHVYVKRRLQWCHTHKNWMINKWGKVIWSDELSFSLFQTTGQGYIWRTPKQAYDRDCLLPNVKHGDGSTMVQARDGANHWHACQ
ncbi:DDE_3 domain-containing protein [Trichonephila clavipes]|nr:DDE_3 domain-containing protein [Trichonephila clavipes]